jgi:serine/threonine protein kinase
MNENPLDPSSLDSGGHTPVPEQLDYQLVRLIGQGSYGQVWLVRDQQGSYHACKVVYRSQFETDRPYEREYEGIRNFEPVSRGNQNQIKILHVGRRDEQGFFYYIMELADDANGQIELDPQRYIPKTLKTEIAGHGRMPVQECVSIGIALTEALENLHQHSLIHRDIKPANIIFVNGQPKLADIGLVTESTATVSYVGTEGYIPPEGPSSAQADIYGLGKMLYEMVTGRDRLEYPELPTHLGDFSDRGEFLELNAILARACQADQQKRYQNAGEMRQELILLQQGESVRGRRKSIIRRRVMARVGAVVGILAIVVLAAASWEHWHHNTGPANAVQLATTKSSLPDPAAVASMETRIETAEAAEFVAGSSTVQTNLIHRLYAQAPKMEDAALKMATFRAGCNFAAKRNDTELVLEGCQLIGQYFMVNSSALTAQMLGRIDPAALLPSAFSAYLRTCLTGGFEAIELDDYSSAASFEKIATATASATTNHNYLNEVGFFDEQLTRCSAAYDEVKPFAQPLREHPDDPQASVEMGKFHCFIKNEWPAGLALLARGTNQPLKDLAAQELGQPPADSTGQKELGDQWWTFAESEVEPLRSEARRRARHWYLKAIAAAKPPEALKQTLQPRLDLVPTESAELHISSHGGRGEVIDITSDGFSWHSTHRSLGDTINQVDVGAFGRVGNRVFKNSGATWILPDDVDFTTAKLTYRQGKHRGKASLAIAEDRVRVRLSDPPTGYMTIDVTVTFTGKN